MFRPEKVRHRLVSLSWHELTATIYKNEMFIDYLEKEYGTKFLTKSEYEMESAQEWWNKLNDVEKKIIEQKTFGKGECFEDNSLNQGDVLTMYLKSKELDGLNLFM